MPLTQQLTIVIAAFYDAPTLPRGIFDDFLAIKPAQGNVSTMSYPDFVLSVIALGVLNSTRSVVCSPMRWNKGYNTG
jgi:hypothetical protein